MKTCMNLCDSVSNSFQLYCKINSIKIGTNVDTLINEVDDIINFCTINFNIFDYFTLLKLRDLDIAKEKINNILNCTVKEIFAPISLLFLHKVYKFFENKIVTNEVEIYNYIFSLLQTMLSEKSSVVVFNLFLFVDFQKELQRRYSIVKTITEAYQKYDPNIVVNNLFKGSTIMGKLLQEENQYIAEHYARKLLKGQELTAKNVVMVGGGGSSLVFKIRNHVLKLGETRNNRKIYINHRILASQVRKLFYNQKGEEQFYVEIMKYIKTGDVTLEEMYELRRDLEQQGLIWEDVKSENCGVLDRDDDNFCNLEVDYVEVAANINIKVRREEFLKRKRKVVLLDNDNISYNPLKSSR